MLKELLKPEIEELIEMRHWTDLKDGLDSWPEPEIAELLLDIDKSDRVLLYRILPRDVATEVFSYLEADQQDELLRDLTDHETRNLLADLSPDDRTDLLEELPAKVTRSLMNLLSPDDLKEARQLLGYPEDSIGRQMTPDFVAVRPQWTIKKSLSHIRKFGKHSETIYRIYITDDQGKLLDDTLLRDIILAKEEDKIEDLMDYTVISVSAFDDQEEAVRTMEKYDIGALPVVDSTGLLVGIVTFDDVLDISEEEATEDFQKISAINPVEQTYLNASVWKLMWKRFPWLLILLFANFITAGIISLYSDVITTMVALTFFIPLLIGTAGNTGTQSATLIIRSLALGDVNFRDWFKILMKELAVGLLLGILLGIITYFRGYYDGKGGYDIAIVISLTMIVLVLWANLIGAVLPIILSKIGLDPAVISSPFIATLIDVTGIIIYFNIAILLLSL
ncbi:magnesium transporter [Bacteroidota bacterium]